MKFKILGVFIYPEMQNEILGPMVKDLAKLDSPFLSYGQKTANFCCFFQKMAKLNSYLTITQKR